MADVEHYRSLLREIVAGRPWVLAMDVLAGCTPHAKVLDELGADRVFCLAGSQGTGEVPDPERFPSHVMGVQGDSIMDGIRAAEAAFADLPDDARPLLDEFDPAGEARVLAGIVSGGRPVAGRSVLGARPAAWQALEDKTVIDQVWDHCGVPRAPRHVVAARATALDAAARDLDRGLGTVWVGDNREGFHGGAEYLRWVRNADDAAAAARFLSAHCDRVRVMPFLDGIPCSIHGIVFAETTIALRPCEMIVFRTPGSSHLAYAGSATFWDPSPADREEMRRTARAVGRHLGETVGYRGVFTLDGVMTADGFLPTELNPRFGGAMNVMATGLADLPLYLLHLAIADGEEKDWRPAELEDLIVRTADTHRRGGGSRIVSQRVTDNRNLAAVEDEDGWRPAREDEVADAELVLGPSPMGGFLRSFLSPDQTPIGPSAAPRIARALKYAAELWDVEVPELVAAPELRNA